VPKIDVVPLPVITKTKPCFLLHNVLSREECELLISASEGVGFEDAKDYCFMYRNRYNDRLMSDDEEFTNLIWERVREFLPQTSVTLPGFKLSGLNQRWRHCRYVAGHYFGAHTDGKWAPSSTERSCLTFMLYLDSPKDGAYEGGCTNFIEYGTLKLKKAIVPDAGMAICFLQEDLELYHEGAKLISGTKHILRTDVMFKKTKDYEGLD